jgi:hypothetical protein
MVEIPLLVLIPGSPTRGKWTSAPFRIPSEPEVSWIEITAEFGLTEDWKDPASVIVLDVQLSKDGGASWQSTVKAERGDTSRKLLRFSFQPWDDSGRFTVGGEPDNDGFGLQKRDRSTYAGMLLRCVMDNPNGVEIGLVLTFI